MRRIQRDPRLAAWLGVALVGVFILGVVLVLGGRMHRRGSPDYEQAIRRDLPVGSSYEQVDRYLTAKQIGHSFVKDENRIYGIIPDVKKGLLVSESLQIVITLDEQHRLQSLQISHLYTGP